jgi:hypothetical protein
LGTPNTPKTRQVTHSPIAGIQYVTEFSADVNCFLKSSQASTRFQNQSNPSQVSPPTTQQSIKPLSPNSNPKQPLQIPLHHFMITIS